MNKKIKHFIDVVVDRVVLKESARARIAQAVEMACQLAEGRVLVKVMRKGEEAADVVTSSGATVVWRKASTCSRLCWRAPSMVIP